jgi:hypothetical protein
MSRVGTAGTLKRMHLQSILHARCEGRCPTNGLPTLGPQLHLLHFIMVKIQVPVLVVECCSWRLHRNSGCFPTDGHKDEGYGKPLEEAAWSLGTCCSVLLHEILIVYCRGC